MTQPGRCVLDTNTLILLERLDVDTLPEEPLITVITLAELSVGPLATNDPQEQAARQLLLQETESAFDPLPLDPPSARMFGRVAASLRRSGRKPAARAFDALVASIALANQLDVYTCNADDFAGIEGLGVVSVPHPDH